ncbi:helix-turn-helix domain-containing protein [Aeromicrobium sp. CTD01-1L150]|uniref:helix-turn-helix domain-containing protein n=1 Tax=Aeromicrobium sp. CTD01-1L150 TaxID=3341830 RepID=UPI0035BF7CB5
MPTSPTPTDPNVLSAVIEVTPTPLWVIGTDGTVALANQAAVALLGYGSTADVVGAPSHDTLHSWHPDGSRYPAHSCPILERTSTNAVSDPEWFITREGRALPVSWSTRPLGSTGHTLLSFADATEQLEARSGEPLTDEGRRLRDAATRMGAMSRPSVRDRIVEHVETRFRDPDFDAPTLARECHLSLRSVQQLLAEDGRSPAAEIRDRRVDLAADLLRSGSTVQSAARASGFSDTTTFTRAFRRRFGEAPGRWAAHEAAESSSA